MLHEHFRELLRADRATNYSAEERHGLAGFRRLLAEAVELSAALEQGLRAQMPVGVLEQRFLGLQQNCMRCHEVYRNTGGAHGDTEARSGGLKMGYWKNVSWFGGALAR